MKSCCGSARWISEKITKKGIVTAQQDANQENDEERNCHGLEWKSSVQSWIERSTEGEQGKKEEKTKPLELFSQYNLYLNTNLNTMKSQRYLTIENSKPTRHTNWGT